MEGSEMEKIRAFRPFLEIYSLQPSTKEIFLSKRICYNNSVSDFTSTLKEIVKNSSEVQNQNVEVTFITHGYISNIRRDKIPEMRNAILDLYKTETNKKLRIVVLVDWRAASGNYNFLIYFLILKNVRTISKWVAKFASSIKQDEELVKTNIFTHAIGHSLGAHLMGMCSKEAFKNTGIKPFDRISGLDPAGPGIDTKMSFCLRSTDAPMVDVLHTSPWYGKNESLGTIDFWPNFGRIQPGCNKGTNASHLRVLDLYLWSISHPNTFLTQTTFNVSELGNWIMGEIWGSTPAEIKTEKVAEMGFHCKPGITGNYYIQTTDKQPWVNPSS